MHVKEHVVSVCPIIGNFKFDQLEKAVSAKSLHFNGIFSPFLSNR